jgi:hypothetical protein
VIIHLQQLRGFAAVADQPGHSAQNFNDPVTLLGASCGGSMICVSGGGHFRFSFGYLETTMNHPS